MVATVAAPMARAKLMRPVPDRAPAPTSIGTAGIGNPACTANAQAKSTTTPYWVRVSGIVMCELDDPRIAQDDVGVLTVYDMLRCLTLRRCFESMCPGGRCTLRRTAGSTAPRPAV